MKSLKLGHIVRALDVKGELVSIGRERSLVRDRKTGAKISVLTRLLQRSQVRRPRQPTAYQLEVRRLAERSGVSYKTARRWLREMKALKAS